MHPGPTASIIDDLRRESGATRQLWHVPFFVTAAEAVRRFVDPSHVDYGYSHGYYAKVTNEIRALRDRGLLP